MPPTQRIAAPPKDFLRSRSRPVYSSLSSHDPTSAKPGSLSFKFGLPLPGLDHPSCWSQGASSARRCGSGRSPAGGGPNSPGTSRRLHLHAREDRYSPLPKGINMPGGPGPGIFDTSWDTGRLPVLKKGYRSVNRCGREQLGPIVLKFEAPTRPNLRYPTFVLVACFKWGSRHAAQLRISIAHLGQTERPYVLRMERRPHSRSRGQPLAVRGQRVAIRLASVLMGCKKRGPSTVSGGKGGMDRRWGPQTIIQEYLTTPDSKHHGRLPSRFPMFGPRSYVEHSNLSPSQP
jgi:hypothetical protein